MTLAIVTGAGGALGRATAVRLARDGHALVLVDIDGAGLAESGSLAEAAGQPVMSRTVDVRREEDIAGVFDAAAATLGPIGILVNNAAIYPSRPFLDVPLEEYE